MGGYAQMQHTIPNTAPAMPCAILNGAHKHQNYPFASSPGFALSPVSTGWSPVSQMMCTIFVPGSESGCRPGCGYRPGCSRLRVVVCVASMTVHTSWMHQVRHAGAHNSVLRAHNTPFGPIPAPLGMHACSVRPMRLHDELHTTLC